MGPTLQTHAKSRSEPTYMCVSCTNENNFINGGAEKSVVASAFSSRIALSELIFLAKAPAGRSISLAFLPQHFVYFLPSSAAPLIIARGVRQQFTWVSFTPLSARWPENSWEAFESLPSAAQSGF